MGLASRVLVRRAAFFFLLSISGCSCALGEPLDDGGQSDGAFTDASDGAMDASDGATDASDAGDGAMDASDGAMDASDGATDASDGAMDAGYVFDGMVPNAAAVLFSETELGGDARLVNGDVMNLGDFSNRASSLVVAAGYTLFGTTSTGFGGTISVPYVGPTTVVDLETFANDWESIIFRPTVQPEVTVYLDVPMASPWIYPIASFPSLGNITDRIDGMMLPANTTLIGYDDPSYGGTRMGPYVGPLDLGVLPIRDVWSSMVVRATNADDLVHGHVILYVDGNYGGASPLVLTEGQYRDLDDFPGTSVDYRNALSSIRGRAMLSVWGFAFPDFGDAIFGPITGDSASLPGNDNWDSIVIQRTSDPTLTVYFDANFMNPATYPLVDVPNLVGNNNRINGVNVPTGYVVHGFSAASYGGTTGPGFVHAAGSSVTVADDWDSFIVRAADEPTVTLYFGPTQTIPREYPLASYPALNSASNQIEGATVPCGVRIRAFDGDDFTGTAFTSVTGPTNIASVPGVDAWSSMVIERVPGASCP